MLVVDLSSHTRYDVPLTLLVNPHLWSALCWLNSLSFVSVCNMNKYSITSLSTEEQLSGTNKQEIV